MKTLPTSTRSHLRNNVTSSARIAVFIILAALISIPFFSSSLASSSSKNSRSVTKSPLMKRKGADASFGNMLAKSPIVREHASSLAQVPENIATFAADCTTPKTTFTVGETVCAQTNNVNLSYPGGRWVDWILTGATYTIVSGSRTTTLITTNPQTFTYAPTAAGTYKVEITEDDGNGGDNPQTPAAFTVVAPQPPPIATYASDCLTAKTSFNLGETVCVKVSGLSNDEWPYRRVQFASPDGFALQRFNVTDNSQQFSYTLPSTVTQTIGGTTINDVGNWLVALIDPEADIVEPAPISVHKSTLQADWYADLQVSKLYIDTGDPPSAGDNISFQLIIFNNGPDSAISPQLFDVTLPNTTFQSFTQQAVGLNTIPGELNDALNAGAYTSYFLEPPSYGRDNAFMPPFSPSVTFNCTPPAVGSPGTTTCTASGSLAPGETATFTATYRIDSNIANGTVLTDNNSATVSSDTSDQATASNTEPVQLLTSSSNPPTCVLTCPDNITVGTNAVDAQNNPGAIVTFAPEANGDCGTGITSNPASGSFFPVGTTPVVTTTGSGATCNFNVTVVNTPQPTITCAANQTAQASSGQTEVNVTVNEPTYSGSFAQNQDPPPLTSFRSDRRPISDPYPIGTTTITWVVTDQYGTQKSCNQLITVTSPDTPTISCPSNKTFNATNGCSYTATASEIGTPTTTGPNVTVTSERSDNLALSDPFPRGNTYIEWTATNSVGSATCTQTITVNGQAGTAPTLNVPPNVTTSSSSCSQIVEESQLGSASASDDCGNVPVSRSGVPPGNNFPTGTTTITYTATNSVGTTTGTQTVTVAEDPNTPPTIHAPASLTVNTGPNATTCGTFVGDATLGTATANDNCPGFVVTRSGVPAGNNFPVGTTTITYRVTDRVGNYAEDTQTVTVNDNTPPVVTPPANVTAFTGAGATSCGTVVSDATLGTATATDNCPGVGAVQRTGVPAGNNFPVGTTTITYSVTDAHSNSSSATQTVTVIDNTPPVISCPASITIEPTCPSGAIATYTAPVGTDNCPGVTTARTAGGASGSVFPIGTTTVTFTATDAALPTHNSASCSFTVTVKTATQTINDMETYINSLSSLSGTQKQGLISKLEAAKAAIPPGSPGTNVACNKLNDFMTQVQNYINNGTLSSAQGQPLLNSASNVRNTIGCTSNPCT